MSEATVGTDLLARLRAAIDETERMARECGDEVGWTLEGEMYPDGSGPAETPDYPSHPWGLQEKELRYISALHPNVVLRRCAADREIVDLCAEAIGERGLNAYTQPGSLRGDPQAFAVFVAMETVRHLAADYGIKP